VPISVHLWLKDFCIFRVTSRQISGCTSVMATTTKTNKTGHQQVSLNKNEKKLKEA
jgi:uncharacterized protein YceK